MEPGDRERADSILARLLRDHDGKLSEIDDARLLRGHPELRSHLESLLSDVRRFGALATIGSPPRPWTRPSTGPSSFEPSPGKRLGDFELVRELGHGAMGTVWEAQQSSLGRRVALKLLGPGLDNERARAFFLREARAGARLRHASIVSVYACDESEGVLWMAQELVGDGETLLDALDRLRLQRELPDGYYTTVAALFTELAMALSVAHEEGILHRDIKPQNIILTSTGRPKLGDFGLARVLDDPSLSQPGDVMGTPHYMSPEQARGDAGIDHRSDLFSLGAVLYEALTLVRAFEGDSLEQVLNKVMTYDPPLASELRSRVPPDLAAIASKAMEKAPARRYASALELADDLRRFQTHQSVSARVPNRWDKSRKWMRRHPTATASMAIVAVAATALLVALLGYISATQRTLEEQGRVRQLSDIKLIQDLENEAGELWPAHPRLLDRYRSWLAEAEDVTDRVPGHRETLEELTQLPSSELDSVQAWHKQALEELLSKAEAFSRPGGMVASVTDRFQLASGLEQATVTGTRARTAWADTLHFLGTSSLYEGVQVQPRIGLFPLGPDPDSGYLEFAHYASGDIPERGPDGGLIAHDHTGIVLVLLPGGTFVMGTDFAGGVAAEWHGLPQLQAILAREAPPHVIELAPFFISKYELTQGQWTKLMGDNPSQSPADGSGGDQLITLRHPVENVSWDMCQEALFRWGLEFPTEAQWEFAARGGSSDLWWFGDDYLALSETANIADASLQEHGQQHQMMEPTLNDGYVLHAPVGAFLPNPFGMHDMYGNVWEWCADPYLSYDHPCEAPRGLRIGDSSELRVGRGGGYTVDRLFARSAGIRDSRPTNYVSSSFGLRPALLCD